MKLFDLHCDTLYELHERTLPFDNRITMVNASNASLFEEYRQIFAIWSNNRRTPQRQWLDYLDTMEYKKSLSLPQNALFSVEGGSLLDGKIERLYKLHSDGIKILTLVWGGECCIGGAHDTDVGLTDFGKEVLEKCASLGIVVDLSHASDRMIDQALESSLPVICTHSNSRTVFGHTRNLKDEHFREIVRRKGIVGLSMASSHIGRRTDKNFHTDGDCRFDDLIDHYQYYLTLGGEDSVCLGCDLDGISKGPTELKDLSSLLDFSEALSQRGIGEALQKKLFFDNASRFFQMLL